MKQREPLLVTLQATPIELIAVGSAIIGYIRLLESTVPAIEGAERSDRGSASFSEAACG